MHLTIPTAAFEHLSNAVLRDGRLYPDTARHQGGITVYPDSDDTESIHWLAHFTLDNYQEWAGAAVVCPRAPALEQTLFRFDDAAVFIANGYRNPFREPGVPDWYFFWTGNHRMGELKTWARSAGIIPQKDLPRGVTGDTALTQVSAPGAPDQWAMNHEKPAPVSAGAGFSVAGRTQTSDTKTHRRSVMTTDPKRQPEGIPTGGQFAATAHAEPGVSLQVPAPSGLTIIDGADNDIAWDSPEDQGRYLEAAYFLEEAGIEGTVKPLYTKYRDEDGLDALILEVDGRNMTVHHAGTMSPQVRYGDDEDDAWTFTSQAGDGIGKNEHEVLADLLASARHDAACQEAWRRDPNGETFQYGDEVNVKDFGVRYAEDGTRIITVDVEKDGRYWELVQRGNEDVEVFLEGKSVPLPFIQLDVLAYDFDEDHDEGTGDIRWKAMMKDAADRAAKEPGYNPRGINRR